MKYTPVLLFWVTLGLVFASGYFGWQAFHRAAGDGSALRAAESGGDDAAGNVDRRKLDGNPPIPAFKLTRADGKEFDSKSMLGKVWVASYFFANCPGPCYRLNQALAALQAEADFNDVQFVSITCDPDNDTPDELREYAKRFSADPKRWVFLTGEEKQLIKIGNGSFALPVASKTHSELAVVLDRNSTIRGYFHLTDEDDLKTIRTRLLHLLKEKPTSTSAAGAKP